MLAIAKTFFGIFLVLIAVVDNGLCYSNRYRIMEMLIIVIGEK